MPQRSRITDTSLSHQSATVALASIAVLWLAACSPSDSGVTSPPLPGTDVAPSMGMTAAFGDPFPNLTADQLALFNAGKVEFAAVEAVDEGGGPLFYQGSWPSRPPCPRTGARGPHRPGATRLWWERAAVTCEPMNDS